MKKVYVNEVWCLGCHLCEYYCAYSHSEAKDMVKALKGKKINPCIQVEEKETIHFAVACRHCDDAVCKKSCIAGAIKRINGVIVVDKSKCVGCYTCVASCPYGAIMPSDKGVVQKCELCAETSEGVPACVQGCPNQAIEYKEV